MYKHLLLPTDGSPASEAGCRQALELARQTGARVTALHVVQPFHVFTTYMAMIDYTREEYERQAQEQAQTILGSVAAAARELGVTCNTVTSVADHPYESIIKTALDQACDLIVMSSHGRRGVQALLMGSETQKVLTHSKLPVLVLR